MSNTKIHINVFKKHTNSYKTQTTHIKNDTNKQKVNNYIGMNSRGIC